MRKVRFIKVFVTLIYAIRFYGIRVKLYGDFYPHLTIQKYCLTFLYICLHVFHSSFTVSTHSRAPILFNVDNIALFSEEKMIKKKQSLTQ